MNSFFRLRSCHPRQHPGWTGHITVALLAFLCIGLSAASRPSGCAHAQAGSKNWQPLVLNLSSEGCTIDP